MYHTVFAPMTSYYALHSGAFWNALRCILPAVFCGLGYCLLVLAWVEPGYEGSGIWDNARFRQVSSPGFFCDNAFCTVLYLHRLPLAALYVVLRRSRTRITFFCLGFQVCILHFRALMRQRSCVCARTGTLKASGVPLPVFPGAPRMDYLSSGCTQPLFCY